MKKYPAGFAFILTIFGIGLFLVFLTGCKKSSDNSPKGTATLPQLTTTAVSGVTSTTAVGGGSITSDGGASVSVRGVCWSTAQNPTTADSKIPYGTGTGSYTCNMTGLVPETPYYTRAYATNSVGTAYGNSVTFTTLALEPGTVTDYDGNIYHTVTIGNQVWLKENLKVTHYRNGDPVPEGKIGKKAGPASTDGEWWNYNNSDSLGQIYGRLYNFYAISDSRILAPLGFRVASDSDWIALAATIGPDSLVGGMLKEAGTLHWWTPNTGATNSSGFTALPGGAYNSVTGIFSFLSYGASLWTSSVSTTNSYSWARSLLNNSGYLNRGESPRFSGMSVRCIRAN